MPAKGQKSSDVTRERVRKAHWTGKPDEERQPIIDGLRERRMEQVHPSLAARGITPEAVSDAASKGLAWCSGECKAFVPVSEFGKSRNRGNSRGWCRKCYRDYMRDYMRKQRAAWSPDRRRSHARMRTCLKYGLTLEEYEAKLVEQGGLCAICGREADASGVGRPHKGMPGAAKLCIDHNHSTGKVRGLLCTKCNTGIERFESVPDWSGRASAYLARHS